MTKKAINIYKWLEWVIMGDQPLSFVEKIFTRKNTNLEPISRTTLTKYLRKTWVVCRDYNEMHHPQYFQSYFRWLDLRNRVLHCYISYMVMLQGNVTTVLLCCSPQDEVDDDDNDEDIDFIAESIGDYIFDE